MDDRELITAIENVQKGIDVEENFNFIYHRSHLYVENRIRFYVHGRKTASYDVEDITQDVYLYMSTRLSALKEPKAFWSWTDKIAAGRTNDFFDSRQGKTIASENALEIQIDADDDRNQTIAHDIVDSKISNNPEQRAMQNATVAAVQEILADLTDAQKEVIIPFFLYNKKEREIAEELNLNLNTVKSRLKSGKDAIYKRKADLRKRGVEIAVIPFVLLLHIAYRSDEALAATLTAGIAKAAHTAASGAKASAEAAASASKAGKASGTLAAKTSTGAGMGKTAAVGTASAAKAAGTISSSIAVKAAAAVAAVAVAAGGGAMVYKSVSAPSSSVAASGEATDTESLPAETAATTVAAAESSAVNSYVDVYGDVLQEFAAEHNFSLEELNIGLFDFDQDGALELAVAGGYKVTGDRGTYFEAIYKASDSTPALIVASDWSITYTQTAEGTYFSTVAVIDSEYMSSDDGEALWLLHDGTCERVATIWTDATRMDHDVLGEKVDGDTAYSYAREKMPYDDTQKYVSETERLFYEDITDLNDEELIALMNGTASHDDGTSASSMKKYIDQFDQQGDGNFYYEGKAIDEFLATGVVRDMGSYFSISNATIMCAHIQENDDDDQTSEPLVDGLELRISKDAEITVRYDDGYTATTGPDQYYYKNAHKFVPSDWSDTEYTAVIFPYEFDDRGAVTKLLITNFG